MSAASRTLSQIKYWISLRLQPRTYWNLMGRINPVGAVTSQCATVGESMASGAAVVDLLDRIGVVDRSSITLQIGSGLGRVEEHLAGRVSRCVGADVSPSMVDQARALVRHDNVEFVCTNGNDLSAWADGSFDLIYSFLVFQHLPRAQFVRYLHEAHSKLRPGGALVFQAMIDEGGTSPEPPASHPYGLRFYTRAGIDDLLLTAGFENVARFGMDGHSDSGVPRGDVVFKAEVAR